MIAVAYLRMYRYFLDMARKDIYRSYISSVAKDVRHIDYDSLVGARLLIFDVDDTICEFSSDIDKDMIDFLMALNKRFHVAILSNSSRKRERYLNHVFDGTGIYVKGVADKPLIGSFRMLLERYGVDASQAVIIGDNPFADMWGGYKAGIGTRILVLPYAHLRKGARNTILPARFLRWMHVTLFIPRELKASMLEKGIQFKP